MPKPPRDTAQKWLAAGALIAVAVGVSFGSNALKTHLASTLPQKEPTSYGPLISSPPPPPPRAKTPDEQEEDAPRAKDVRIAPLGSPKSSLAATPPWGHFDESRAGDKVSMRYAPIHSRAAQIFATASAPSEDLSRGFVVCRGSTTDEDADLLLRVTIGTMPEIASDAKKQLGQTYVSAPLVDAQKGEKVDATLFVRKAGGLAKLAELHAKIGDDLQRDLDTGTIECVALSGDELQDRIAADAGRADFAISRLGALRVDTTKDFDIDPDNVEGRAQRRIGDLAALLGWSDPRVKARLTSLEAALAKNDVEERRAFDVLYRSATTSTVVDGMTHTLDRVACVPDRCNLAVLVRNDRDVPYAWDPDALTLNFLVVRKDRIDQESDGDELQRVVIPANQQRKVILRGQKDMASAPSLVQICVGPTATGSCGVLRVH